MGKSSSPARYSTRLNTGRRRSCCDCRCKCSSLCVAFCFMLTCSVAMLIVSVNLYVLSFGKQREHLLDQYRGAINRWMATDRERFGRLNVSAALIAGGALPAVLLGEMKPEQFKDVEEQQGTEKLPSYKSLVFRASGSTLGLEDADVRFRAIHDVGHTEYVSVPVKLEVVISDSIGRQSKFSAGPWPLLSVKPQLSHELYTNQQSCLPSGGYRYGKCWVLSYLAHASYQIAPSDSGWALSPRNAANNESFGCSYARGSWDSLVYKSAPRGSGLVEEIMNMDWEGTNDSAVVPEYLLRNALAKVAAEGFTLEVRSHADPYLNALELTDGSLNFGLSAADEQEWSLICFALALMLAFPPSCVLLIRRLCVDSSCDDTNGRRSELSDSRSRIGRAYVDFDDNEV
eukprot:TRINITY_DN30150_c0_g2_i1.p1 TRINITY_DN30150_c0_g2~~TRINITY_DN30150_c0_g2_i1.p1  ORF type:complete len:422 (+),score=48.22 TRINITY_DN30150_c0_g2_i1:65-1267(+)